MVPSRGGGGGARLRRVCAAFTLYATWRSGLHHHHHHHHHHRNTTHLHPQCLFNKRGIESDDRRRRIIVIIIIIICNGENNAKKKKKKKKKKKNVVERREGTGINGWSMKRTMPRRLRVRTRNRWILLRRYLRNRRCHHRRLLLLLLLLRTKNLQFFPDRTNRTFLSTRKRFARIPITRSG